VALPLDAVIGGKDAYFWGPCLCPYVLPDFFGSRGSALTAGEEGEPSNVTHTTRVILPSTPNPGLFGNEGLCSESKISHEAHSSEYLCLVVAIIQ
jgi:hypothetical protein